MTGLGKLNNLRLPLRNGYFQIERFTAFEVGFGGYHRKIETPQRPKNQPAFLLRVMAVQ
jgi:hypothetical protein